MTSGELQQVYDDASEAAMSDPSLDNHVAGLRAVARAARAAERAECIAAAHRALTAYYAALDGITSTPDEYELGRLTAARVAINVADTALRARAEGRR